LGAAEDGSPARRADRCLAAGHLFFFAGAVALQEAAYRRGLSFKPEHPTLNHNLGNLLMERQEFAAALPHFLAALENNPRLSGSALNAGVCQMRLGRPNAAASSFRRAAAIDPNRFEAWANLSAALSRKGDLPGTIQALEKALELRPQDRRLEQRLQELKHRVRDKSGPHAPGG
jgi:Tfp pilus assembly protein PilF